MTWKIKQLAKAKILNPVLIEGLPGMGNVGKIAVDYLIDTLKAKKLFEMTSYQLPHCVFVNDDNLVELPEIEVYYKNFKDKTLLFLAGDIQPLNEESCYDFCHTLLDNFEKGKGKEIITLGGVALPKAPMNPKVYATGNSKKILDKYYKSKMITKGLNQIVGPIVGVSGLLTGLAGKRNIPAVALLAETYAHPNYLDIKGAKEILKVLSKQFNLKLNLKDLTEEIDDGEEIDSRRAVKKIIKKKLSANKNLNYIG